MTDDLDLSMIVRAASQPSEQAGTELVRAIVNYSLALGYTVGVRPEVIASVALWNCTVVLAESLSDSEWADVQMRIANLLEQQAHEEAA